MAEPFVGEIRMVGFDFAPKGWSKCDGQLIPVSQNSALFSLLGTKYGGDGVNSFGLPDFRSRSPMHYGSGPGLSLRRIGEKLGTENVTLTVAEIPNHNHSYQGNIRPGDNTPGTLLTLDYRENITPSSIQQVESTGGGQSHQNMQPTLVVNFVIAMYGLYPSRN